MSELTSEKIRDLGILVQFMVAEYKRVGFVQDDDTPGAAERFAAYRRQRLAELERAPQEQA